jgi:hypothetical protein
MLMLALLACSPEITLTPVTDVCQDVDLDNPGDPQLLSEGTDPLVVYLKPFVTSSGLEFDPTFATEGRELRVYQDWSGTPGDADFCYQPTVELGGVKGKLEVRWYLTPEDASPYATIEVKGG